LASRCNKCNQLNDTPERTRCSRCRDNHNIQRIEQRIGYEDRNLCTRCGKWEPAEKRKMCVKCIEYMVNYRKSCLERTGLSWSHYCHGREE